MTGVEVIDRPQLNSDVTKGPIINARAGSGGQRSIGQGIATVARNKRGVVAASQGMYKAGKTAGVISDIKARPEHVGEIGAVKSGIVAIVEAVTANVRFRSQMPKQADRCGRVPAIETEPLSGRTRARIRRKIKAEVGVAAEHIDGRSFLS
jgi:hypothetical protein